MQQESYPRQSARTHRFTAGAPRGFAISPDGARVVFVRSGSGTDVVGRVLAAKLSPARIPADIVTRLNAELQKAVAQSDVRERFAAAGVESGTSSPDELAAIVKNEIAKWSKVIKDAGIRAD